MTGISHFETKEAIEELSKKTGIEEEELNQKIKEKINQYSGLLTEQGALVLLSKEMKVSLSALQKQNPLFNLGEIKKGMNNADVKATISFVNETREYNKNGKEGKYLGIRLKDETGEALLTFWNEQIEEAKQKGLEEGATITLHNVRIGEYNQTNQILLGYNTTYEIEKNTLQPNTMEKQTPAEKKLIELKENELFSNKSHIVDVLLGKGMYVKCKNCGGKLAELVEKCPICQKEGKIEAKLLLPLLLDDGTSTMRAVAFEEQAIQIYQKSKEEILEKLSREETKQELRQTLFGKQIKIEGKTKKGMDGTSIEILIDKAERIPFEKKGD